MIEMHDGIEVVRDDLYPGGTKSRYLQPLFMQHDEVVYASPVCGGAQIALATVAAAMRKQATIFCAGRATRHPRTLQAEALGAKIIEIRPGYMSVCSARALSYCDETGAYLAPFGLDVPWATRTVAQAALGYSADTPDEVWCAAGSGTLSRGLQEAWPSADHHVVQVGRTLSLIDVGSARVHMTRYKFEEPCREPAPFPCDLHYEAKAWAVCQSSSDRSNGRHVLFWSVLGKPS